MILFKGRTGKLVATCGFLSVCLVLIVMVNDPDSSGWLGPLGKGVSRIIPSEAGRASEGEPAPSLPPALSQRILNFDTWLDSLKQDSAGGLQYERMLRARPGLLDSIRWVRSMYHLNKND